MQTRDPKGIKLNFKNPPKIYYYTIYEAPQKATLSNFGIEAASILKMCHNGDLNV